MRWPRSHDGPRPRPAAAARDRLAPAVRRALPQPRAPARGAARAAAPVARHRLCRQPRRAPPPELLLDRRVLGTIVREFTLKTYAELLQPANLDVILRTVVIT